MATPNTRAQIHINGDILTADETAALLKIGRRTAIRLFEKKEIPAKKVGKQWRCFRSSVDKYMEAR